MDVVVTSTDEASHDWLADLDRLREVHRAPIVGVLRELPTPYLMRALARRLEGIVMQDSIGRSLVPTVDAVLAGQSAHPQLFHEQLDEPLLSPREKQVLAMVVLGFANIEIGSKLFVSEASVKAHLTSAFAKLGVRSREAATALILDPNSGYGPGILRITPDDPPESQR